MKIRTLFAAAGILALGACGTDDNNAQMLKGANFVSQQPGANITLTFDPETMRVSGRVVNMYNGAYEVSGDTIQFGPLASTMMMGPDDAMQTEQAYFQFMSTANAYELVDGRLTIKNPDGQEIIFQQVEVLPADGE